MRANHCSNILGVSNNLHFAKLFASLRDPRRAKSAKFWAPPPFGPPTLRAPTPSGPPPLQAPTKNKIGHLAKFGQQKLAKFGQTRMAKCGHLTLAKCGIDQIRFGQMRPNKDGQIRFGQMRSRPRGPPDPKIDCSKLDWPKLDWPKLDWAKTTMAKNGLTKIGLAKSVKSGWPKRDWPKSVPSGVTIHRICPPTFI